MIFHTFSPDPPLGTFVDRFIYYSNYDPPHDIDRFLPDGNTELIIDLSDSPKHIYHNVTLAEIQSCKACWASGVRTKPISIPSGKDSAMFIIIFRKGMAYPFFPVPLNEVSDHVVQADFLWREFFRDFRDALLEKQSPAERFSIGVSFLDRRFRRTMNVNRCVQYAVDQIVRNPIDTQMDLLSRKIGYSQKHFIQMFKEAVGVPPKTYLKIMRFQKAIHEIEKTGALDWTQLALETGYYDQSHFIHEFKRFSEFTPEEYRLKKNGMLNYVPVG